MRMRLSALVGQHRVEVLASYKRTAPYEMVLAFGDVSWVLGRELFGEGLRTGQAGAGDVRVTARGDLVVLGLSTPDGTGSAILRRDDVEQLVRATYLVVPAGRESESLDWSGLVQFPGVSSR
ncbi:SsgA family sporulation/cell division regulator [Amycolatopsis sp. H20-H5]|uniref:SsgA family sporulation/cell division regulator n=1 Tax=Amycolatopsis sp. H20-H5 TaxID=3046309 RepID=UPI002DBDB782|nr:SsgA family sporulation/cell division regulator [Amycolatopsis sp. H20-H5]MEC3976239.1 SsgA family sporulation/cell division regulator [Amycolatopsis sp. H20-H5]